MPCIARTIPFLIVSAIWPVHAANAEADNVPELPQDIGKRIELAFGAAVTSDYISKGSTQTQGNPAVQGYVELIYDPVYVGVWASNVQFDGVKDVEIDFYGGIRPTFGNLGLDLGFAYYYYTRDPADYGEFYLKADYTFSENFSAGTHVYQEPFANETWVDLVTEFSGLPFDMSVSGKIGSDFGTRDLAKDKFAWDIGLSKNLTEKVTIDLRYYDSNLDPGRIVATLSMDTSVAALGGPPEDK